MVDQRPTLVVIDKWELLCQVDYCLRNSAEEGEQKQKQRHI